MCRSFNELGFCKYGDRCQFCHTLEELRDVKRHPKYKTEICKTFWNDGSCPYGSRCCFVHRENAFSHTKTKISDRTKSKNSKTNKTSNSYHKSVKVFYETSQIPDFDVITNPINHNNSSSSSLSDICDDNGKNYIQDSEVNEQMKSKIDLKDYSILSNLESVFYDKSINYKSSNSEMDTLDLQLCISHNTEEILELLYSNEDLFNDQEKESFNRFNTNDSYNMFRNIEINNYSLKMPKIDCESTKRSIIKNFIKSKPQIPNLEINSKEAKIRSEFEINNLIIFKQARALESDISSLKSKESDFKFSIEAQTEYENKKDVLGKNLIEKWKNEPVFYVRYDQ